MRDIAPALRPDTETERQKGIKKKYRHESTGELRAATTDWGRGANLWKGPWTEGELIYLDSISF